jgi:cytoskeletal protein CcmA (bactofilin family)
VSGKIDGNIIVGELLTVKSSAIINGDINTSKLIIESGAEFNGHSSMKDSKNSIKITEKPTSQSLGHKAEKAI